ncbi:solute carrier family 2, facilitated glucose transporter member 7-like [Trichechus inunguis]
MGRVENEERGSVGSGDHLAIRATPAHAAFGSAFQYGYNVAMVNTPHKVSKSFYNETYFERHGTFMDENVMLLLWSCTVSMFPLGGLLGSLVIGLLVVKCGRKGTLLINNFFTIVPAILMGVSKVAKAFELIIFSQVMLGICAGWPVLLAIIGIPALLQLLSLPFPPTPKSREWAGVCMQEMQAHGGWKGRWKGIGGGRGVHGWALRTLCSWAEVEDEIEEMCLEDQAEKAEGRLSVLNLFTFRSLRWQLITIVVLMAGQQFSGVNTINYYTDMIYVSAGVEAEHSQYITVGAGVVNIVITIISEPHRVILDVVATLALEWPEGHALPDACGLPSCPVPSMARTEIFLQSSGPAAFTVDGAVHWLTNFIIGFVFPSIQEVIGAYSFIIFAVICLLTAVYIHVVIPETKGITFVEINQIFAKRNGVEIPEKKEEIIEFGPHVPSTPAKQTAF